MNNLVICAQYLEDKKRLPQKERMSVDRLEFNIRYEQTTPGMHKEMIKSGSGQGLFSYRASDDLRVIAYEWKRGDILLLLVDHHDRAYSRAKRLVLGTGHLSPKELPRVVVKEEREVFFKAMQQPCRLSEIPLDKLAQLVGSREVAADLQLVKDEDDLLEKLEAINSPQLRDDLIDLADCPSKIDAILVHQPAETERAPAEKAVKKSEGWCLLDDATLTAFYNGTLEDWQIFLHPSQRSAIEEKAIGPMLVTGSADTGKTVVAVHRAKWLLQNVFTNGERILFTTFTRTLARIAKTWLETICPPDMMSRIDVRNFDEFIRPLVNSLPEQIAIDFEGKYVAKAISSSRSGKWDSKWLQTEFEEIILEFRIASLEEYMRFQRPSRYGRLSSIERETLWPVFEAMRREITKPSCRDVPKPYALNRLAEYISTGFGKTFREYSAIIVDEFQDFGASEYRFFAAYTGNTFDKPVPNSLFFAGDGYQRIYGRGGTFKSSGINIVNRSLRLQKCYRSTNAIRQFAERIIADVNAPGPDGVPSPSRDGESLTEGIPVEEKYFPGDFPAMYNAIASTIGGWMATDSKELRDYAVLLPKRRSRINKDLLFTVASKLTRRELPCMVFDANDDDDIGDAVRVMTMHSAKGLQFHGVVVCLDNWPWRGGRHADSSRRKAMEDESKCLLYMAIMRASYRVLLTAAKSRPTLLPKLGIADEQANQTEVQTLLDGVGPKDAQVEQGCAAQDAPRSSAQANGDFSLSSSLRQKPKRKAVGHAKRAKVGRRNKPTRGNAEETGQLPLNLGGVEDKGLFNRANRGKEKKPRQRYSKLAEN